MDYGKRGIKMTKGKAHKTKKFLQYYGKKFVDRFNKGKEDK